MDIMEKLPGALLPWYDRSHRELPWRADREPYHIWLSEIMLQQTRVEAVKGYYSRFLETLPTVEALAGCGDDTLQKLWEGLGYYSRVRNLKKAAGIIVSQYGGEFPRTYREILALPGIGTYTAGAICSIAFDLHTPAVDGNVLRVISRLTEDHAPIDLPQTKASVREALARVYPARAGDFTQALMELGATVCGPNRAPDCGRCPCRPFCGGANHGTAEKLPVKTPKKDRRTEEKTVFILSCDGRWALRKRPDTGLLAGLWEFPNVPGRLSTADALTQLELWGLGIKDLKLQLERSHIFTHIRWDMRGIYAETAAPGDGFIWLTAEDINNHVALPTAFRQFWEETYHV